MQMIASGFFSGDPDPHLVFINILVGWVLCFLYNLWPGCNWYFIFLVAVHYAALTLIAFVLVSRRGGWIFALLYIGFFLIVETRILLHLQFTTTAFLAGTAGLLLLVDGLQPGQPVHRLKYVGGIALIVLMILVREAAALLLAVIAFPFLWERLGVVGWRRLLGMALACMGVFLILHGLNRWAYQSSPAWGDFFEYNRVRGEIHATELADYLPKAASAVGWSNNDQWMYGKFYFPDPDVYAGLPRMHLLLETLKAFERQERKSAISFSADYLWLPGVFTQDARTPDSSILMKLAILNALFCLFAARVHRTRCFVTLLVSYAVFTALGFYLLETARLPERVSYNIPLFLHVICLYWATGLQTLPNGAARSSLMDVFITPRALTKTIRMVILVLILVWTELCLFSLSQLAQSLWSANQFNRNLKVVSRRILNPIKALLPSQARPVLIIKPERSVLEQCLFFLASRETMPFSIVPYGWLTHSPIFYHVLDHNRLHPFSLSLLNRSDVFFLMPAKWSEPLRKFYREHYGLDIRFHTVLNTDTMPSYEDYRLRLYQARTTSDHATVDSGP